MTVVRSRVEKHHSQEETSLTHAHPQMLVAAAHPTRVAVEKEPDLQAFLTPATLTDSFIKTLRDLPVQICAILLAV